MSEWLPEEADIDLVLKSALKNKTIAYFKE